MWRQAFEPGRNISSDKQDASFQGHHEDKHRVTFKHAGYVFLVDSVCGDGYTINFYPRNVPPPKKWIEKGCSLTHSRIIVTLDALPNKYYTCGMNNLFISEKFFRAAYAKTKSQTMVPGVFRKKFVDYPTLLYKNIIQHIEKS